ncbi:MAG: hypothetical protein ACYDBQ_06395 [Thermoplasmatota archaeon]
MNRVELLGASSALDVEKWIGKISIQNSSLITSLQLGFIDASGEGNNHSNAALHIGESYQTQLTLRNLTFSTIGGTGAAAVSLFSPSGAPSRIMVLHADGVTVSGYRRAIFGDFVNAMVKRFTVDCVENAIVQDQANFLPPAAGTFQATDVTISNCTRDAIDLPSAETAEFSSIRINGARRGISLFGAENLSLTDFAIQNTSYGLVVPFGTRLFRSSAAISDGSIMNASYAAVQAQFDFVAVRNVTFLNDGYNWPDPTPVNPDQTGKDSSATDYGGLVVHGQLGDSYSLAKYAVSQSSFDHVTPYAFATDSSSPVDARQNWWGSALGPTVRPDVGAATALPAVASAQGGNVTQNVVTFPFLTTAPG